MTMSRFHFWFGVFGILVFLLTGQYMDYFHQHLEHMADKPRLYFRSAHIYIFLCSLMSLFIGAYYKPSDRRYVHYLQYLISFLLVLAWFLYLAGFFIEYSYAIDKQMGFNRPYISNASYLLMFAAVLLCFQVFLDADNVNIENDSQD